MVLRVVNRSDSRGVSTPKVSAASSDGGLITLTGDKHR